MKKVIVLTILIGVVLSGCGVDGNINDKMKSPSYQKKDPALENTIKEGGEELSKGQNNQSESERVYGNFMKMVDSGKKPFELIAYIDGEIEKVTVDRADEMILALEEVQYIFEDYYQQMFFGNNADVKTYVNVQSDIYEAAQEGMDFSIVGRVSNGTLKSLLIEVFNSGYKLESKEGTVYSILDYAYLKKYSRFISQEVADYIDAMAMESDKYAASDGAVVIPWKELSERLLKLDKYMKTYKNFEKNANIRNLYYKYMQMFLIGLNNTPAYDYATKVYKDEVIKSFKDLTDNNKGTKSAEIVKEYQDIIQKSGNTFSREAQEYTSKMFSENIYSSSKQNVNNYKYINNALAALLPEKPGYRWLYNGFAEYGHEMTLEEVEKENDIIKYRIKGEVADMSDGESGRGKEHFKIDLEYTINNAAIMQTKSEKIMMDSDFDSLELIKAPLIKGNKWGQELTDKSGNARYLNCEITDIKEVGNARIYTVEYRDQDSSYYEKRMIEEGVGVVSFNKLFKSENDSFEIGYSLYKDASGY